MIYSLSIIALILKTVFIMNIFENRLRQAKIETSK